MKYKTSAMVLFTVALVASGLVGYISATTITSTPTSTSTEISPATAFVTTPLIAGKLTLEARDADGNLKAIRTSDNVITRNGEDCVAKALFTAARYNSGSASAGTFCVGAITQPFQFIALGTGVTPEQGTDNNMQAQTSQSGLGIAGGAITTWTNSTGGAGAGSGAIITISKTFTNGGGSINISEAGLFNSTDTNTNGMFAHKTFAPITLAGSDQLTVNWTITLGNTTTFN